MPEPPPDPPQPSGPEPLDAFNQLKWSILDPPSDVQVFERNDEAVLQWHLLSDAQSQSVLDSAAMQAPQSRLQVCIEPLNRWWHWHHSGMEQLRPAELVIENENGQAISVRQFIWAVHDYAIPLRPLLLRCMDVRDPVDQGRARFFFDGITAGSDGEGPGQRGFAANVIEDITGDGEECAWVWEGVETRVKSRFANQ